MSEYDILFRNVRKEYQGKRFFLKNDTGRWLPETVRIIKVYNVNKGEFYSMYEYKSFNDMLKRKGWFFFDELIRKKVDTDKV